MSGTNDELDVARQALVKARDDLMGQLAAEPAWRALRQLEWRGTGHGTSTEAEIGAIRADLHAQLDAAVPKWRTLTDIDAAIAALGTRALSSARPRGELPPPPPVSRRNASSSAIVPHVRIEPERTRYASQARPAAEAPRPPDIISPVNSRQALSRVDTMPTSAPQRRPSTAGGRLAAALGLGGEGPARLSAIESEVERLMRREVGTWDAAPAMPAKSARSERPAVSPIVDLPGNDEEAEVEIVLLAPTPQRDERRSIPKLTDRLSRVADGADDAKGESVISMQARPEDASVEIEIRGADAQAPLLLPHQDAPKD
jgi:hypothetical protein